MPRMATGELRGRAYVKLQQRRGAIKRAIYGHNPARLSTTTASSTNSKQHDVVDESSTKRFWGLLLVDDVGCPLFVHCLLQCWP